MKNRNKMNYNYNNKTEFKDIIQLSEGNICRANPHYQI